MSAEVPKLHHRLPLGEAAADGERPPAEVVVLLADPALVIPPPSFSPRGDASPVAPSSMAFQAMHRFEFV